MQSLLDQEELRFEDRERIAEMLAFNAEHGLQFEAS